MARSILRWALPLVIVAFLAYPLIRRSRDNRPATPPAREPNSADQQLNRSLEAYQAGNYQEAIRHAQAALKARPNFALAYNNLAVSYLQLKMYPEAIENAEQAIRLQPHLQLAKNNLAWIEREMTRNSAPLRALPRPVTADEYLDQSLQHYQAGRFRQSIEAARQALKLDPDMAAAYNNIAASYASMKMWDQAIDNAQKALRLRPDMELARNNLVWALKGKAAALAQKKQESPAGSVQK